MKYFFGILILSVTLLAADPVPAQEDSHSIKSKIVRVWQTVKAKIISWWDTPTADSTAANSDSNSKSEVTQETSPKADPGMAEVAPSDGSQRHPAAAAKAKTQAPTQAPLSVESPAELLRKSEFVIIEKSGRSFQGDLLKEKRGVPVLAIERGTKSKKNSKKSKGLVSEIPRLDIGDEAVLKSKDFTGGAFNLKVFKAMKPELLDSPKIIANKDTKVIVRVADAIVDRRPGDAETLGVVTLQKVQDYNYRVLVEPELTALPVSQLDEQDLKFMRALMLYVAGDKCHYSSGLFHELKDSKKESLRDRSHFYLGECLSKMGLFHQSREHLQKVLSSNLGGDFKVRAFTLLTEFPQEENILVGTGIEKSFEEDLPLKPEVRAKAAYMIAAGALRREAFNKAKRFSEKVPEGHSHFIKAQFISAISDYQLGQAATALTRLRRLQTLLPQEDVHRDLHALISLNLARIAFQEKQHEEASKYYLSIEKNHPLWITGLIEHAWNQLASGNNEGAIGNMFSLQSTYLKAAYRPESFIVRTIGYLNLCQYADAYKSLTLLERDYRPWLDKIDHYQATHSDSLSYYKTMVHYLNSPSQSETEGLPYQALREIGRHKDFLNIQEEINRKIDEEEQFKLIESLANRDFEKSRGLRSQASMRLKGIEAELHLITSGKKLPKEENQLKMNRTNEKNLIEFYDFQLSVFKEASGGLKKMKEVAKRNLSGARQKLASSAGEILKLRLSQIEKDLKKYFENNEFLRYEVFAGSGENIRFHLAGGDPSAKRLPASAKPENKNLNWEFEGEFWEDEIGHYKTTLKNNCSQKSAARN